MVLSQPGLKFSQYINHERLSGKIRDTFFFLVLVQMKMGNVLVLHVFNCSFFHRVLFLEENICGKERVIRETQDELATFKYEYYQQKNKDSNLDCFEMKNNFLNKVLFLSLIHI